MFKKKSLLSDSRKFLKECYDKGATIEYEEEKGKWVGLPKNLPIDFSKFEEGVIRLKYEEPTYEQVEKFTKAFGSPIVKNTDFKISNIDFLSRQRFLYNKRGRSS